MFSAQTQCIHVVCLFLAKFLIFLWLFGEERIQCIPMLHCKHLLPLPLPLLLPEEAALVYNNASLALLADWFSYLAVK